MNQRTAKLIRRFAIISAKNPRSIKRAWNITPWPKRAAMRSEMIEAKAEKS